MLPRIWRRLAQTHCSDEALLSYLDGELSKRSVTAVEDHLRACWQCRASLSDLDRQTQAVVQAFNDSIDFGPCKAIEAKNEFLSRAKRFEAAVAVEPSSRRVGISLRPLILACATAACAVLVLTFLHNPAVKPGAAEVVAVAQQAELLEQSSAGVLRQVVAVRLERAGTNPVSRQGVLHIWSDARQRLYSARWTGESGHLRKAMWRERGRDFVYQPVDGERLRVDSERNATLSDLADDAWSSDDLEAAFLRWLERRDWKPLLLARDFALLGGREGFVLQVEQDSARALRIRAWNSADGRRLNAELLLDPNTKRPKLQRIEVEQGGKKVAVSFALTSSDRLPAGAIPASNFSRGDLDVRPLREPARNLGTDRSATAADDPAATIDAAYALHRLGACLGEPVEVSTISGRIVVRGLVETEKRREQIVDALAGVGLQGRADIRTVHEVVADTPASNGHSSARQVVTSRRSPFERQLSSILGVDAGGLAQFSADTIGIVTELLDHAWALRRLTEQYPHAERHQLPVRAQWLLETMTSDHLRATRDRAKKLNATLGPTLSALTLDARGEANAGAALEDARGAVNAADDIRALVEVVLGGATTNEDPVALAVKLRTAVQTLDERLGSLETLFTRRQNAARGKTERRMQ